MQALQLHCLYHVPACRQTHNVRSATTHCQINLPANCRASIQSNLHQRPAVSCAAAAVTNSPQTVSRPHVVPQHLRKYVAHVEVAHSGSKVQVYVLGVSHVSRQSCRQTDQLIEAVKPETVLLELCKDRVDLLIDPSTSTPQHWHTRTTNLQGVRRQQASIMADTCRQLTRLLHCQPGQAFSAHDIEQDCVKLLSSGIFGSAQPANKQAALADAPAFIHSNKQVFMQLLCTTA